MTAVITDAETLSVQSNRCPDCYNWGFIPGPRSGAGQNIYCANPECRAAFMVGPREHILVVERVDTAPEAFYPPRVHIVSGYRPLCNFSSAASSEEWPVGHSWVTLDDPEAATCHSCRVALDLMKNDPGRL